MNETPASFVMSVNRTFGISASGLCGATGAVTPVTRDGAGGGLCLSTMITPTEATTITANARIENRTALPMTASSAWTSSSSPSGGDGRFSLTRCSFAAGRNLQARIKFGCARSLQWVNHRGLRRMVGGGIRAARDADGAVLRVVIRQIPGVLATVKRGF